MSKIDIERQVFEKHRANGQHLTISLRPVEKFRCSRCLKKLNKRKRYMHELRDDGTVDIYCSDDCWIKQNK